MLIHTHRSSLFRPGQNLEEYLLKQLRQIEEGSIIAIASKIVALSQNRVVTNTPETKKRLIQATSDWVIATKGFLLTQTDGHWCPNAGIDESNANGKLILWPQRPYEVAESLRKTLMKRFALKKLGILITDSRIFPLRAGVTGVALGYAGFQGLRDYRGRSDLFGRTLVATQTNVADTLASAAILLMGEGNERQPIVVIKEAPVRFVAKVDSTELWVDPKIDLFRPLFNAYFKIYK